MKVIAYVALHYGSDYLFWSIKSVIDYVDECYVLYAAKPSHNHRGNGSELPLRESRANLLDIAKKAAGDKLRWYDGDWRYEGQQRDSIHEICPDADVVVVLDSDEIWQNFGHNNLVAAAELGYQRIRHPIIHYWRSFYKCVLHDPAFPVRLIFPKNNGGEWTASNNPPINHMGYAIKPDIMDYKWTIHGHLNELRTDVDWYRDVFLANRQTDMHPTGHQWKQAQPVDPLEYMPHWMISHPFYEMSVIE